MYLFVQFICLLTLFYLSHIYGDINLWGEQSTFWGGQMAQLTKIQNCSGFKSKLDLKKQKQDADPHSIRLHCGAISFCTSLSL